MQLIFTWRNVIRIYTPRMSTACGVSAEDFMALAARVEQLEEQFASIEEQLAEDLDEQQYVDVPCPFENSLKCDTPALSLSTQMRSVHSNLHPSAPIPSMIPTRAVAATNQCRMTNGASSIHPGLSSEAKSPSNFFPRQVVLKSHASSELPSTTLPPCLAVGLKRIYLNNPMSPGSSSQVPESQTPSALDSSTPPKNGGESTP